MPLGMSPRRATMRRMSLRTVGGEDFGDAVPCRADAREVRRCRVGSKQCPEPSAEGLAARGATGAISHAEELGDSAPSCLTTVLSFSRLQGYWGKNSKLTGAPAAPVEGTGRSWAAFFAASSLGFRPDEVLAIAIATMDGALEIIPDA